MIFVLRIITIGKDRKRRPRWIFLLRDLFHTWSQYFQMKRQGIMKFFVSLPHPDFRQLRYKEIENAEPDITRIIMHPCNYCSIVEGSPSTTSYFFFAFTLWLHFSITARDLSGIYPGVF